MDFAVLTVLADAGYLKSIEKEVAGRRNVITVHLAYTAKKGAASDFKLISKPSRHQYVDYRSLRRVMQGHGLGRAFNIQGVMTDREAKKNKIGGEYLFEIW